MTQNPQAPFEQWLETAQQFGRHSAENVACPCCGSTSLSVKDVEMGSATIRACSAILLADAAARLRA